MTLLPIWPEGHHPRESLHWRFGYLVFALKLAQLLLAKEAVYRPWHWQLGMIADRSAHVPNTVPTAQALRAKSLKINNKFAVVLPVRIELTTSPLPRECSTTELRQQID